MSTALRIHTENLRTPDPVAAAQVAATHIAKVAKHKHEWIEQDGEPPYDVCYSCGKVRR